MFLSARKNLKKMQKFFIRLFKRKLLYAWAMEDDVQSGLESKIKFLESVNIRLTSENILLKAPSKHLKCYRGLGRMIKVSEYYSQGALNLPVIVLTK